jgi:histone chaperone ASF1
LDDDGAAYGAEEAELEAALVKELEEVEHQGGEDQEMEVTGPREDDDSDAGSEDLEAESSGSEEEDLEEDEAGDGDEDVEMADDAEPKGEASGAAAQQPQQHQPELMVH